MNPLTPSAKLLVLLGSIAVHAEELLVEEADPKRAYAAETDRGAIRSLLSDPDFRTWRIEMDGMAMLPVPRERP